MKVVGSEVLDRDREYYEAEVVITTTGKVLKSRYTSKDVTAEEALAAAEAQRGSDRGPMRVLTLNPETREFTKSW